MAFPVLGIGVAVGVRGVKKYAYPWVRHKAYPAVRKFLVKEVPAALKEIGKQVFGRAVKGVGLGLVTGVNLAWKGLKLGWSGIKAAWRGIMGWDKNSLFNLFGAGVGAVRSAFPSLEEEIQVVVTGNANSTKRSMFLLGMAIAFGNLPKRLVGMPPNFTMAVNYDMMAKLVQITFRYKYTDAVAQAISAGLGIFSDALYDSVPEQVFGCDTSNSMWFNDKKFQQLYGATNTAAGVYNGRAIAGPYGTPDGGFANGGIVGALVAAISPPTSYIEPLPPGDGKSRGSFLELLLYNTLARPAQYVPSGTGVPGVRTGNWNAAVSELAGIGPNGIPTQPNLSLRTKVPLISLSPNGVSGNPVIDATNNGLITSGDLTSGDFIGVNPVAQNTNNGITIDSIAAQVIGYG